MVVVVAVVAEEEEEKMLVNQGDEALGEGEKAKKTVKAMKTSIKT